MLKEFLRNVLLFNGLTQEQLEGLQDISNRLSLNGEKLIFS